MAIITKLTNIADAIRAKVGSTAKMTMEEMATVIKGITLPKNQDKTVTSNGSVTADTGYTGLGTVTVNVNNTKNQDKTITENGTYKCDSGYTGLGNVTVNVEAQVDEIQLLRPGYFVTSAKFSNDKVANDYYGYLADFQGETYSAKDYPELLYRMSFIKDRSDRNLINFCTEAEWANHNEMVENQTINKYFAYTDKNGGYYAWILRSIPHDGGSLEEGGCYYTKSSYFNMTSNEVLYKKDGTNYTKVGEISTLQESDFTYFDVFLFERDFSKDDTTIYPTLKVPNLGVFVLGNDSARDYTYTPADILRLYIGSKGENFTFNITVGGITEE